MKILQVIPFFSPKFGGSLTVAYNLSKELAKRNHEVTIITTYFEFDQGVR
jgi:glycogen synthase